MARRGNSPHRRMSLDRRRFLPVFFILGRYSGVIPAISKRGEQENRQRFRGNDGSALLLDRLHRFRAPTRQGQRQANEYFLLSSESVRRRLARCGCGLDRLHHHCRCMPGRLIPSAPGIQSFLRSHCASRIGRALGTLSTFKHHREDPIFFVCRGRSKTRARRNPAWRHRHNGLHHPLLISILISTAGDPMDQERRLTTDWTPPRTGSGKA